MAKKEPQQKQPSRWTRISAAITNWWNPLAWVTALVIFIVYLLDSKHVYELFIFRMTSHYAYAQATFFGVPLPVDNRTFDAAAFSIIVSALTYLLSQYIPKRLGESEPARLWVSAFLGGLTISAFANANSFVEDISGQQLAIFGDNYWTWILVGVFITFLLAFFVGIDAWDALRKKRASDAKAAADELNEFMQTPAYKNAPNNYKQQALQKRGFVVPTPQFQSPLQFGKKTGTK